MGGAGRCGGARMRDVAVSRAGASPAGPVTVKARGLHCRPQRGGSWWSGRRGSVRARDRRARRGGAPPFWVRLRRAGGPARRGSSPILSGRCRQRPPLTGRRQVPPTGPVRSGVCGRSGTGRARPGGSRQGELVRYFQRWPQGCGVVGPPRPRTGSAGMSSSLRSLNDIQWPADRTETSDQQIDPSKGARATAEDAPSPPVDSAR